MNHRESAELLAQVIPLMERSENWTRATIGDASASGGSWSWSPDRVTFECIDRLGIDGVEHWQSVEHRWDLSFDQALDYEGETRASLIAAVRLAVSRLYDGPQVAPVVATPLPRVALCTAPGCSECRTEGEWCASHARRAETYARERVEEVRERPLTVDLGRGAGPLTGWREMSEETAAKLQEVLSHHVALPFSSFTLAEPVRERPVTPALDALKRAIGVQSAPAENPPVWKGLKADFMIIDDPYSGDVTGMTITASGSLGNGGAVPAARPACRTPECKTRPLFNPLDWAHGKWCEAHADEAYRSARAEFAKTHKGQDLIDHRERLDREAAAKVAPPVQPVFSEGDRARVAAKAAPKWAEGKRCRGFTADPREMAVFVTDGFGAEFRTASKELHALARKGVPDNFTHGKQWDDGRRVAFDSAGVVVAIEGL